MQRGNAARERGGEDFLQLVGQHRRAAQARPRFGTKGLLHVLKADPAAAPGAFDAGKVQPLAFGELECLRTDRAIGDYTGRFGLGGRRRRCGRALGGDLGIGGAEAGDEGVDIGVAGIGIGEDGEQGAHRMRLTPGADQHPARDGIVFRLDLVGDLGGLDQAQRLAAGKGLAFAHHPFGDSAFGHLDAPFGHAEGADHGHYRLLSANPALYAPPPRSYRPRAGRHFQAHARRGSACAAA